MRKQITRFSVHQTSKVIAAVYAAILTLFAALPMALHNFFNGHIITGILILILLPFFYWAFLYVINLVWFWLYNYVANTLGGIEFDVVDVGVAEPVIVTEDVVRPHEQVVRPDDSVVHPDSVDRL